MTEPRFRVGDWVTVDPDEASWRGAPTSPRQIVTVDTPPFQTEHHWYALNDLETSDYRYHQRHLRKHDPTYAKVTVQKDCPECYGEGVVYVRNPDAKWKEEMFNVEYCSTCEDGQGYIEDDSEIERLARKLRGVPYPHPERLFPGCEVICVGTEGPTVARVLVDCAGSVQVFHDQWDQSYTLSRYGSATDNLWPIACARRKVAEMEGSL